MKVRGSVMPEKISVTEYGRDKNFYEIRLRTNIQPFEDGGADEKVKEYIYDEYLQILKKDKKILDDITNHFDNWITSCRFSEISTDASLYVDAKKEAIDAYTKEIMTDDNKDDNGNEE